MNLDEQCNHWRVNPTLTPETASHGHRICTSDLWYPHTAIQPTGGIVMSQLIYSPFTALNQLHRELGRVFDDGAAFPADDNPLGRNAWVPQVDISEDEHRFLVTADLPGVNPKAVDVTVDGNILTIRGERATDSSASGAGYKRRERISGAFIRQFALPETVDGKSITARAANGVLEIKVPKGERHQPVNITVES